MSAPASKTRTYTFASASRLPLHRAVSISCSFGATLSSAYAQLSADAQRQQLTVAADTLSLSATFAVRVAPFSKPAVTCAAMTARLPHALSAVFDVAVDAGNGRLFVNDQGRLLSYCLEEIEQSVLAGSRLPQYTDEQVDEIVAMAQDACGRLWVLRKAGRLWINGHTVSLQASAGDGQCSFEDLFVVGQKAVVTVYSKAGTEFIVVGPSGRYKRKTTVVPEHLFGLKYCKVPKLGGTYLVQAVRSLGDDRLTLAPSYFLLRGMSLVPLGPIPQVQAN